MATKKKNSTKKKQQKKVEEPIYVGVSQPLSLYKHVLETSKQIVVHLHKFEQVKSLREEKKAVLKEFTTLMNSIKRDLAKIDAHIPKPKIMQTAKQPKIIESASANSDKPHIQSAIQKTPQQSVKSSDDISQLEDELLEIERKLANL